MNEKLIEDAIKDVDAAQDIIETIADSIKLNPLDYYQMEVALKLRETDNTLLYLEKALQELQEIMNNTSA